MKYNTLRENLNEKLASAVDKVIEEFNEHHKGLSIEKIKFKIINTERQPYQERGNSYVSVKSKIVKDYE